MGQLLLPFLEESYSKINDLYGFNRLVCLIFLFTGHSQENHSSLSRPTLKIELICTEEGKRHMYTQSQVVKSLYTEWEGTFVTARGSVRSRNKANQEM